MHDLIAGRYRLPWEDEVKITDASGFGFPASKRAYHGAVESSSPAVSA